MAVKVEECEGRRERNSSPSLHCPRYAEEVVHILDLLDGQIYKYLISSITHLLDNYLTEPHYYTTIQTQNIGQVNATLIHIIYKFVHEPPIDQVMVIVKLNAANLKIKQLSLNSKVCKPELPLCFSYMSARGHSLQPLKLHHDRSTSDPQLKKTVEI